ncbi:MAG: acyl-CoA synthetase FdrA [Candidatus Acetothermia bacterium]|nr:acyl-CoA synthetase FdrA [Candidatus Acetothermia bacterium]
MRGVFRICQVQKRRYFDSMFLMRVTQRLRAEPGVAEAAAVMGTPANIQILLRLGFPAGELAEAGPDDLVVALAGAEELPLRAALEKLEELLAGGEAGAGLPRTLAEAVAQLPQANLAVISLPGRHAVPEARAALEQGLSVFLFSSNVPVEEEVALKRLAAEKGLLVMGPDCGTAIVAGVGLGFANAVRQGPIGLIAASGTGAQEFTTLVHRAGSGISHALGTGGRDLSDAVGGTTTLTALDALAEDPATEVIVILSKPPGVGTVARLAQRVRRATKPVIACFLGLAAEQMRNGWPGPLVAVIDDAVAAALRRTGVPVPPFLSVPRNGPELKDDLSRLLPRQRYARGIFAGGTFCYQAQLLFHVARVPFRSNAPLTADHALATPWRSEGHTLLDMGDEFFTEGRLHPMIDPTLRQERIRQEAEDPEVAALLLDFVLGYNASPDPVGDLIPALVAAREHKRREGGDLVVVASVCGAEADPQNYREQVERLTEAGARVFPTQAQAARYALTLLKELK